MKHSKFIRLVALSFCLCAGSVLAQAPLDVTGIADRNYSSYNNQVSFSVPSTNGYSYLVTLDGQRVPTDVTVTVNTVEYHEVSIWRTNLQTSSATNRLVRFIVVDSNRAGAENGIPPWTPYPTVNSTASEFLGAHLRVITPQSFPTGYPVPVVAWVENDLGHAVRANGLLSAAGHPSIQIKRGVGSGFLATNNPAGALVYSPVVGGLSSSRTISLEASTTWTVVSGGTLAANTVWPVGSRIHITGSVTNPAGSTVTIGAGTIVKLNPSVDFANNGAITINGTTNQPVVFMPATNGQPWGGFVQHADNTAFTATGAIFTGAGAYQGCWFAGHGCSSSLSGIGSHRGEQALISLKGLNCNLTLTDCAAMYLAGQFSHSALGSYSYQITLTHFLMQRVTTGGEYTGARFNVNDSAFIECNEDLSTGEFPNFVDGDDDGLYIVNAANGAHGFTNTLFGWTTDDGVDSGGSGAGQLNFQSCWFDSIYHEGNSLSGTGKDSRHYGDVFINCGQGIEDGYDAPTGRVDHCLLLNNNVGVRFGDNYDWTYNGFQWATNSISINNYRDVWGMNWQTDANGWIYRTNQMDIRSNIFSVAAPLHPNNSLWNPAADSWRLTNYMTIPLNAPVGVGLAVWTNQFALSSLFNGVPVRLSSFTTNTVTVNYSFADTNGVPLAVGALAFAPGETLKRIYPGGFNVAPQSFVRVLLTGAANGELTGQTNVTFLGSASAPQLFCWASTNVFSSGRLPEGLLAKLSAPSGLPVSVNYAYAAGGSTLGSGTLTFAPGETVKWIDPAGINPLAADSIQLTLSNPSNAPLTGITSMIYGTPPPTVSFAVGASQLALATFTNGLPVALNRAVTNTVTVDFRCQGGGVVLTNGTLTLTAGQTLRTLSLPTVNPALYDLLRVSLVNAANAQLSALSNVFYVRMVALPSPLLVASNSAWKYLDTGVDAGTAWRPLGYNDSAWSNGVAQLGFGDSPVDETTLIRRTNASGGVIITFYFRQKFVVPNPALFTNLSMWMLRDDGGVVYINGTDAYRSPSMPQQPTAITYLTVATNQSIANAPADNSIDTTNLSPSLLVAGTNILAVEIHQHDNTSSDISFDFALTGLPTPVAPAAPVITSPVGGQSFPAGASVPVSITASGFTNVALYVDTARAAFSGAGPYNFTVTNLGGGSHQLVALGTDATGNTVASAPVTITLPVNQSPIALDDGAATTMNTPITLTVNAGTSAHPTNVNLLLRNDSDPDNDPINITGVSPTSTNGGSVTLAYNSATSNNVATYTPLPGFSGLDRFSYTVSDGRGGTAGANVVIMVAAGNLPGSQQLAITPGTSSFHLRFHNVAPGTDAAIWRTTDFTIWTLLTNIVVPLHGVIDYDDTNPPPGQGFYLIGAR